MTEGSYKEGDFIYSYPVERVPTFSRALLVYGGKYPETS